MQFAERTVATFNNDKDIAVPTEFFRVGIGYALESSSEFTIEFSLNIFQDIKSVACTFNGVICKEMNLHCETA